MIKSSFLAIKNIMIGNFVMKFFSFISSIVMARLLAKEDFGLWVVVTIITSFVTLVFDVAFEYYYMIKVDIDEKSEKKTPYKIKIEIENTVFFLKLLFAVILFFIQYSSSYFLDGYYFDSDNSSIDELIRLTSFSYLITPFGVINEIRFKKAQDFKFVTLAQILGESTNVILKISLAFLGFGVFSIAYGSLFKRVISAMYISVKGKFLPRFNHFNKKYVKEILWFAKHSWLSGFLLYLTQQVDKILLKSLYSLDEIGEYNFGGATAQLPVNYLVAPQNSLIMSYVSNYKDNVLKVSSSFSKLTKLNILLIFPILFIFYNYGEIIISFVYGEKWLASVAIFNVFLLYCFFRSFCSPFMPVFTALGKIKENTLFVLIQSIVLGIVLYIGFELKVDLITYTKLFVYVSSCFLVIKSFLSIKYLGISFERLFDELKHMVLYIFSAILIYAALIKGLELNKHICSLVFMIFYAVLIWKEGKDDILKILKPKG